MPKTIKLGVEHAIEADDIIVFDPNSGIRPYGHSMSGSFTWPSGRTPGSIMVNNGKTVCENACHQWLGFPETVLYRYRNGIIGIGKFKTASEIPNRADLLWAVGGVGLLSKYKPSEEGFCKGTRPDGTPYNYTDVLRQTSHAVLAVKQGKLYGVYIHSKSAYQVNLFMKANGFEKAIMLDGGHITAMHGSTAEAHINLDTQQGFVIQFLDRLLEVRPLVAFDAGHNELNQTNISPDGTYEEWEGNIKVVLKTIPHLKRNGIDSVFIDVLNANQTAELTELVSKINRSGADICISRHDNAAPDPAVRGMELFCYKMQGESLKLARCLEKEMLMLNQPNRGVKDGSGLAVVRDTTMPCVLVESAFHTNQIDITKLKSDAYLELEAQAIARGIVTYFGKIWVA